MGMNGLRSGKIKKHEKTDKKKGHKVKNQAITTPLVISKGTSWMPNIGFDPTLIPTLDRRSDAFFCQARDLVVEEKEHFKRYKHELTKAKKPTDQGQDRQIIMVFLFRLQTKFVHFWSIFQANASFVKRFKFNFLVTDWSC